MSVCRTIRSSDSNHTDPLHRRDGRLLGRFNPTTAIIRLLRLQETGRQTYYFKKQHAAAAAAAKKRALALTSQKGLITCMTYIERKRQLVFCTSNGFLSFWDSTVGCLIGFVRTGSAQIGICLSPQADAVVTWPGEVDDTAYRVWDINSRKLRCQAVKHNGRALALLEIAHHRCMVSSTLDREVVMWPISQLKKIQFSSAKNTYLHGHHHAINRLVYAPDHDLLLGSGFDYDVYVWDMASKLLIMCLTGHRCSIVSVVLVYTPFEHAVSVDDGGTVKVWNIDLADNKHAEVLQTIVLTRDSPSQPVLDATLARANGSTLAVLGDSLYMVDLLSGAGSNETKPVSMGLGICEACDSVYVVTNRVLGSGTLSSGGRMRRYLYMDDDRVENATGVHLSLNRETMGLLGNDGASHLDAEIDGDAESQSGPVLMATRRLRRHEKEGTSSDKLDHMRAQILNSLIDPKDDISATAHGNIDITAHFIDRQNDFCLAVFNPDPTGKKLFVGTTGGKIFIYDTASFGLLTQIKAEIPTTKAHGAVVALEYIPQDELLVASYAAGAVRVLLGCHRTAEEAEVAIARSTTAMAEAKKVMAAKEHEHDNRLMNRPGSPDSPGAAHSSSVGGMSAVLSMINCPLPVGGKPHPHPVLIRRNDSVQEQMIMAMAVSREYGLIAVSGDDGSVRLVDYFSMRAVGVLCAPLIDDKPVECSHLAFAPHVPVLFGAGIKYVIITRRKEKHQYLYRSLYQIWRVVSHRGRSDQWNLPGCSPGQQTTISLSLAPVLRMCGKNLKTRRL